MLAKTGLLIVSNPTQISKVFSTINKKVKNILYVQFLSALNDPVGVFHPNVFTSWPKFTKIIYNVYSQAANHCDHLDVRILLSGIKYKNTPQIKTSKPIDIIIFDKLHNQEDIENFLQKKVSNLSKDCSTFVLDSDETSELPDVDQENEKIYKHAVLGGTFDRMHMAHRMLLTETALRAKEKVTIGVTDENMIKSKILWELIEPVAKRIKSVEDFLKDICPEVDIDVVPIKDPFGPTQNDETMDLMVVSSETLKGGIKCNEVRKSKGLPLLEILNVELICNPNPLPNEELKISSSSSRMRILGTLLKPIEENKNIPVRPYVIGLTGVIGGGKSSIAAHLTKLGAQMIDCDKVAHRLYLPGKPCYEKIVKHFGTQVIGENREINRPVLGSIVFSDPDKLKELNGIVWPEIGNEILKIISESCSKVVVVDAALLLTAGWDKYCHEIWVTVIPEEEAVRRIVERKLSEEQARARLAAQNNNKFFVDRAHVVFCTLWSVEYTFSQVKKAWDGLQERIPRDVQIAV